MGRLARVVPVGAVLAMLVAMAPGGPRADAAGVRYRDLVFDKYTSTKDVVYGQAVNVLGELETLTLDVHEPAGDTATLRAAVVWVHGGYFLRGSKEDYRSTWEQFVRAGFVTVSINYRLNPTIPEGLLPTVQSGRLSDYIETVRDAQHDTQAAIRWVRANAAELGVDPSKVAVAGHSAGGLTTNMVAFNDHDPGTSGNPGYSSRPDAAVAMAGGSLPILMTDVGPGEPPFLAVHGLLDTVVPYIAVPPSCLATILFLNVCEQVLDPDQDHGVFGHAEIREFLHRWLINPPGLRIPVGLKLIGWESLLGSLATGALLS